MLPELPPTAVFIAGPTAVGKSALALELANRLGGEIVSVDSMQVYRGLDLGTAKPSPAERMRVPHHLIDVVDVTTTFDAAQFVRLAEDALTDIQRRGRLPILCGGTGLYFKALMDGIGSGPAPDPALRVELESKTPADLLKELQRRDPATFARIDRHNLRRVVRALEVIRLTGRPAAEARSNWSKTRTTGGRLLGLSRSSEDLRRRIDARVDQMFAQGLVAEVARLRDAGLEANRTASQAIGYRQVLEHLRRMRSLPDTMALVKQRSRQFAKRQLTWFRGQFELQWIDVTGQEETPALADRLLESGGKLGL